MPALTVSRRYVNVTLAASKATQTALKGCGGNSFKKKTENRAQTRIARYVSVHESYVKSHVGLLSKC